MRPRTGFTGRRIVLDCGAMQSKVEHLYVHVPFCAAKCGYCAFYSEPRDPATMAAYVDAVTQELAPIVSQLALTTIFFGGGTPSILPAPLLDRLLDAAGRVRCPSAPLEWTIECNPATLDDDKLRLLRDHGVNRLSLGVQAFDDDLLHRLGRIHTARDAIASYNAVRAAGFRNVNLDLIFALPGQTLAHWQQTLQRAIELQPDHLSCYSLTFEEDTAFWNLHQQGRLHPNPELESAMFETTIDTLAAAGYQQYEISNFAKPGRECQHNLAYWQGADYLGLGPSACSTVTNRRWQNVANIDRYVAAISHQLSAVSFEETLTPELRAGERVAFGMRMTAGVPAELVRGRWDKEIAGLLTAGLVEWYAERLRPTRRGLLFADAIAAEFV